jgi:hypothetical protein
VLCAFYAFQQGGEMKIFTEETTPGKLPNHFVLILDKREARTLLEMAETARNANKKKSSFRVWKKKLEEELCVF